jgi:protein TonB
MAIAVSASALVHAMALVAVLMLVRPGGEHRPVIVLPVSLVSRPGGGAGGEAGPAPAAPTPAESPRPAETPRVVESPPTPPAPIVRRKPVAKAKPALEPAPPSAVVGSGDAGGDDTATAARGGGGGGTGSGPGFGSSAASPAYGVNPQPPYPLAARRLGLEGTVVLRVVVAPDGAPASVVVLQSSGHPVLDSSALETVRTRWRFVPARRNGIPVEDSVQVPIRFRQTAG